MVKQLNNMNNKKSNSYKPYDTSNSFVRRVTSRVTQLLPQPTSWLSRFLAREPEQAGPSESQQTEHEEIQPPPSKRFRTVQTGTDLPLSYHQNSLPTLASRRLEEKREEELSPIRSYKLPVLSGGPSRSEDPNVAGPSGISTHRFVASTPAVLPDLHSRQSQQPKINGEDGSDSDSGSHASSLQPESQPSQSLFRSLNINKSRPSHRQPTEDINNSLLRSKQMKLDLSSSSLCSSRGRVSFDTTVFNSPFKGRLCGGLSVSRDESMESPFYRSNTVYGGASSCNDSMLRTRSLHSEMPIVVQPSDPHRGSDNLGSSTKKILKALEQFSTPMLEQSRRAQVRERGVKRKCEVPYKELVIPQMPDLLRIKRRDVRHMRQNHASTALPSPSPALTNLLPQTPSNKPSPPELLASQSSSSHLSHRLSKASDKSKDKVGSSSEKRIEEAPKMKEARPLITRLPITSLPKFDSDLVKQQKGVGVSGGLSTVPESSKAPPSQFTFSKPTDFSPNLVPDYSIPFTLTFSQPLDPDTKLQTETKPLVNCVNTTQPKGEVMRYFTSTNVKLKKKESAPPEKHTVKAAVELKTGSVLDILQKKSASKEPKPNAVDSLKSTEEPVKKVISTAMWECQGCYVSNLDSAAKCAACEQPRKPIQTTESSKGFGDKFKVASNQWECQACLVRNLMTDMKCIACNQPKPDSKPPVKTAPAIDPGPPPNNTSQPLSGFGDKFKPPTGSWECSVCLVQNKSGNSKCVSCSSEKPGASAQSSSAAPLSNLFKKPEGSWECDTCLVRNKSDVSSCVSCGTTKPGSKPTQPAPTFSFGIPASTSTTSSFSFGVSSTSTSDSAVKTTPAFTSPLVPSTQATTPTFTFGIPSSGTENKTPSDPQVSAPVSINVDFTNKSKENSNNQSEKTSKPEPVFSFGVPEKSSENVAVTSSFKSIFGNVEVSSTSTTASSSVVSTSASSNLPIFVNQISSTKSPAVVSVEKTTAPTTAPVFTFGSSSAPIPAFGKPASSENNKPSDSLVPQFNSNENQVKPMVTSPVNKTAISNSVESQEKVIGEPKQNLFTFGSGSSVEKKPFLNSSSAETPNSLFGSSTVNSFSAPNTSAPVKPVFNFTGGFPSTNDTNQVKNNSTTNFFSSQPPVQQQASAPEGGFNFKPSEPNFTFTQKKPEPSSTPFQFSSGAPNHTSFNNSAPPTNQFNSGFGTAAASSPFSSQGPIFGSPAPQPVQTASFLFGASQASDRPPPAPTFNFGSQGGGNKVGNTAVAGGFAFGQAQGSTVQTPAFDPNVKPVFNFSGGQTPIFSATAAPNKGGEEERKIRKAFRRTTQK